MNDGYRPVPVVGTCLGRKPGCGGCPTGRGVAGYRCSLPESRRSTHFNHLNDREAAVIASAISRDEYHESNVGTVINFLQNFRNRLLTCHTSPAYSHVPHRTVPPVVVRLDLWARGAIEGDHRFRDPIVRLSLI